MAEAVTISPPIPPLENAALTLSRALPALLADAQRIANTIAQGVHGRRRAGPGETFWQFRVYEAGDSATSIDWRRSASSDRLYVRELEWEAAQTLSLWCDISPSMMFRSNLSDHLKGERAILLTLALSDLLARGGERVGLIGHMPPRLARTTAQQFAQSIAAALDAMPATPDLNDEDDNAAGPAPARFRPWDSLPPPHPLARQSVGILISDFLEDIDALSDRVRTIAANGARGHIVMVLDPVEETFPFSGRTEFQGLEHRERHLTDHAQGLRAAYQARLAAQKSALKDLANRFGWSVLVHHTDRPAQEALLALYARIADGARGMR